MSAESINVYNTLVALLSLVALIAAVSLATYRAWRGPDAASALGTTTALWMAWTVAVVAMVGSLIYSEVLHFEPCRMCWYQRIAMYPLTLVLLVGALRKEAVSRFYALPLAVVGLSISIWHYLTQLFPDLGGDVCDPLNPCSSRWVEVFGFISIPFMAGAGFILIAVLLAFYVRASNHE